MFLGFSGSKDLILSVLTQEWPLSAKEIFLKVQKESSKEVSYQAIHKLLNLLVDEKVILKNENKYLINCSWVSSQNELLLKLSKNLLEGAVVSPLNQELVFNSIYECDTFLANLKSILNPGKDDELALIWYHFWIPLFFSKNTYRTMKEILTGSKFYAITPNNSPIDKWCADFWGKLGINKKVGVKDVPNISMLIFGDLILQVFYPVEIKKALDEVYNSTDDPSKLDIDNFFTTVFEKKTRIPVLISKNKEVADELMKQIKANFKN
jgi:predicted transcriptional regulator